MKTAALWLRGGADARWRVSLGLPDVTSCHDQECSEAWGGGGAAQFSVDPNISRNWYPGGGTHEKRLKGLCLFSLERGKLREGRMWLFQQHPKGGALD